MTLPVSGPLSLTDIQTEFGGSNPIDLTEYYAGGSYVPAGTTGTNGAVPSSGTISINSFYGTANAYDFSFQETVHNSTVGTSIDLGGMAKIVITSDNKINTYGDYKSSTSATGATYLMTVNAPNGVVLSKFYNASALNPDALALDTSNSLYAATTVSTGGLSYKTTLTKYNSSGTFQWTANMFGINGFTAQTAVSSAGSIYVGGTDEATATKAIIAKTTSSGGAVPTTYSWARTLVTGSTPTYAVKALVTDSSDNVYAFGQGLNSAVFQSFMVKYNSSGTLQWQRRLTTSTDVLLTGASLNPQNTNHIYVCGYYVTGSGTFPFYGYIDAASTGTVQGQKTFSSGSVRWQSIVVGASGNAYVLGKGAGAFLVLAKYNGLTLLWQRSITRSGGTGSTPNPSEYSLALDSDENIYVGAQIGTNSLTLSTTGVIFKLPNDGSKIGTWTNVSAKGVTFTYTYAATTYTDAIATVTDSTGSYTFASVTLSSPTSTTINWNGAIPVAAETFSATTTIIP